MSDSPQVAIIDDDEVKRETMRDEFELADWAVIAYSGPFQRLAELTERVLRESNRAVCDHHFFNNYAAFNGAAAVAELYRHRFPAVLVTQYEVAEMVEIRKYRRCIPVLLTPKRLIPIRSRNRGSCAAENSTVTSFQLASLGKHLFGSPIFPTILSTCCCPDGIPMKLFECQDVFCQLNYATLATG